MKTIKEVAGYFYHNNTDGLGESVDHVEFEAIFKAGVEFATKWIPVEEELPDEHEGLILLKYKDRIWIEYVYNMYNVQDVSMSCTHWRPINFE